VQATAAPQYVPIVATSAQGKNTTANDYARVVAPFLAQHCLSCHGESKQRGDVNLSGFKDAADVRKSAELWRRVSRMVTSGIMPPENRPQPGKAQRQQFVRWIEETLSSEDCELPNPGRVTLRRLNREEYNNTVRDLLDINFRPADDFPSDDVGYGFDNIGDVLSISPLLMEKYLDAAEQIADKAIAVPLRKKQNWSSAELTGDFEGGDSVYNLYTNGEAGIEYSFPADGTYVVRGRAYESRAGDEASRMEFRVDGKANGTVSVDATSKAPQTYERRIQISKGRHRIALAFLNDFYREELPEGQRDRNLYIESLEIEGPLEDRSAQIPASQREIIFVSPQKIAANPDAAARQVVTRLALRAYRRPPTPQDVERLMSAFSLATKHGESFESGIQLVIQAVLVSPHFLFRVENEPSGASAASNYTLNSYELATRLSYFLWSSMPDEKLLAIATRGELVKPQILEREVQRMLRDPQSPRPGRQLRRTMADAAQLERCEP
jgi:hypothetical protein